MSRLRIAHSWLTHRLRRFGTREALARHQAHRLALMARHAFAHAPFYRERMGAPTAEAVLAMAPIDKATMMANFDRLNTAGVRLDDAMAVALRAERERDFRPTLSGLTVGLSSGTSGSRGLFLVSEREQSDWAGAILERLLPGSLFGPRRDRIAFFLRANSNLYESLGSRRVQFTYFDLLEPLERALPRLSALAPTLVVGPPSLLVALAEAQASGALRIAPERVVSVAEVLDAHDEAALRRAFRCPVHQVYQATEGLLATTCSYGTLHLAEDLVRFERDVLDAARGTFVPILTDLFRTTQPILRYRLDDVLVERSEPCLCGSVFTGLTRVEGRADDLFYVEVAGALERLYPDFVRRAVITAAPGARAYHVRQRGPAELELFVDDESARAKVADALRALFVAQGGRAPAVRLVAAPVRAPGAKLRRVERLFTPEGVTRAGTAP